VKRALDFPAGSVTHLAAANRAAGELAAVAVLERAGLDLGLVALPAAVEDSLYRYNNLPPRLAGLFRDIDPLDPDEDVLEEAEPEAQALVDQAYLLDEVIDAIYDSLRGLPHDLLVRRADSPGGLPADNGRAVLLALKRLVRQDWAVDSVAERLTLTAGIGVEARPVLVHARAASIDVTVSAEASRLLGRSVAVEVDDTGGVVRVQDVLSRCATAAAPMTPAS